MDDHAAVFDTIWLTGIVFKGVQKCSAEENCLAFNLDGEMHETFVRQKYGRRISQTSKRVRQMLHDILCNNGEIKCEN